MKFNAKEWWQPHKLRQLQNEHNLKNEDNIKHKDKLKKEDALKNESELKNEDLIYRVIRGNWHKIFA